MRARGDHAPALDHTPNESEDMMNKQEALKRWRAEIKPGVLAHYGKNDLPALRLSWQTYTDQLCKAGQITQKQYATWTNPPESER